MEPTRKQRAVIQPAFRAGSSFFKHAQSQVLFSEGLAFFMRSHGKPAGRVQNGRDCDGQLLADTDDAAVLRGFFSCIDPGNEARCEVAGGFFTSMPVVTEEYGILRTGVRFNHTSPGPVYPDNCGT